MGLSGGGGAEGGGGAVGEPEGAGVSTERVEGGCLRLRVGAGAGAEGGFAAAALMTGKGWGVCFRLRFGRPVKGVARFEFVLGW